MYVKKMDIIRTIYNRPTPSQAVIEVMKDFLREGGGELHRCVKMAEDELAQEKRQETT